MKVLFIGFGSIAMKHREALYNILPDVEIFALRHSKNTVNYSGITNIYKWEDIPNNISFIIISNPTSEHFKAIDKSVTVGVPLFIEKPPLDSLANSDLLLNKIKRNNIKTYVGFNLRFHPIIRYLKENMKINKVREVNVYCGSSLPTWRNNTDYKNIYSAIKEMGGGVHLDLIHEIDYTLWLFGKPLKIKSEKGKKSNLEINSFDYANYLLEYETFYVNIVLNYYRKDSKRIMEIVMEDETWEANLVNAKIKNNNNHIVFEKNNFDITLTYLEQMKYFLSKVINSENHMNNLEEALKTLKICLN